MCVHEYQIKLNVAKEKMYPMNITSYRYSYGYNMYDEHHVSFLRIWRKGDVLSQKRYNNNIN